MTLKPKPLALLALLSLFAHPAVCEAYEPDEIFSAYDHYHAGYDEAYADDWFYDYYEYDPDRLEPYYAHYTGFDYTSDLFGWEELGLFR